MNRERLIDASDRLIVVDRFRRRRTLIIAAVLIAIALVGAYFLFGRSEEPAAAASAAEGGRRGGGQIPGVTVIVPGRTDVVRTITASGALAARRDEPVGVAGEGGQVSRVYVDAGSWVRQGQVLASIDRSVQGQEANQLAAQIQVARADAALAQNELGAQPVAGRARLRQQGRSRPQARCARCRQRPRAGGAGNARRQSRANRAPRYPRARAPG